VPEPDFQCINAELLALTRARKLLLQRARRIQYAIDQRKAALLHKFAELNCDEVQVTGLGKVQLYRQKPHRTFTGKQVLSIISNEQPDYAADLAKRLQESQARVAQGLECNAVRVRLDRQAGAPVQSIGRSLDALLDGEAFRLKPEHQSAARAPLSIQTLPANKTASTLPLATMI